MDGIEPWVYGDIEFPQCGECAHLRGRSKTCAAFPDGIPAEILSNSFDHRKPYEGDHGIRWEPDPILNTDKTNIIDELARRKAEAEEAGRQAT